MSGKEAGLSARYYIAEASVWVFGGILAVSRFAGLAPGQSLPVLNITPENSQHFPRIVAILLLGALLYMLVEWSQSPATARTSHWERIRAIVTVLWAFTSLTLAYAVIVHNTRFAGVSPLWFLAFIAIGLLLGTLASMLTFDILMIRTPHEANRAHLPRVPIVTLAQLILLTPLILVLFFAYYILLSFSPPAIHILAPVLVTVFFLAMVGMELATLVLSRDENGNRVPCGERIAQLKKAYDSLDYSCFLMEHGDRLGESLGIPRTALPQDVQQAVRQRFAMPSCPESFYFSIQLQEDIEIRFYQKDGDPGNKSPQNLGVKIRKREGKNGMLHVVLIPDDAAESKQEMEIPIALLETCAEEWVSSCPEDTEIALREVLCYALDQTVTKVMKENARSLLNRVVLAGQSQIVRELIGSDVDVNEKAEFGWTALLAASAQGYPEIAKLLLDAGANPDIGNVHGRTPLMFGARYGNVDICRVLLEYGAVVDTQDVYGMTALMTASREGHQSVVELLLDAGANPTTKTPCGKTALDFAYECKQGKIAKRLRQALKIVQGRK